MKNYLFTSESVTEGHPDKVCDIVSDSILDAIITKDPNARVAVESFCTTDTLNIMGEVTTSANVDYEAIAREAVKEIGYTEPELGFDYATCDVTVKLEKQSADIAMGVDKSFEAKNGEDNTDFENGAGDQGLMFGFACDETPEYMPLAISLAHKLSKKLTEVRKSGTLNYLKPDGKSQVTVEYEDDKPKRIDAVVISSQHSADVSLEKLREDILVNVIKPVIPAEYLDENTKIYINPTGRFVIGGPKGDTGLTGRKIIVDTYGGYAKHGGGAFSGKDPTKVDRSAAYMARYVAKNIVAAGLAKKCEIQLAYAIGVAKPVSVNVETYGTSDYSEEELSKAIEKVFDLRPTAIIKSLDLRKPIYKQIASYGHLGRTDLHLPWEQLNKTEELKKALY